MDSVPCCKVKEGGQINNVIDIKLIQSFCIYFRQVQLVSLSDYYLDLLNQMLKQPVWLFVSLKVNQMLLNIASVVS